MKKIVGLLTAAAVLATSVFAADVSAKVRVGGNIFEAAPAANEKGDDATALKLLNADTISHTYDAPFATLTTSTDNAGGTVKFVGDENGLKAGDVAVWFKPIDALKITAGSQDFAMNKETITWDNHDKRQAYGTYGYSLSFAQDAISANVAFGTGDNGWFFEDPIAKYGSKEEPAAAYVKDLYANFAYGADFGTISAFFRYRGKSWDIEKTEATSTWTKVTETTGKWVETEAGETYTFNPTEINFGAAYKNTIDALTFFVNVIATSKTAATDKEKAFSDYVDKNGNAYAPFGLCVDAFVQYAQDALTLKGFVQFDAKDFSHENAKGDKDLVDNGDNTALKVIARVDYKLDNGITLFGQFTDKNLLLKKKAANSTSTDPASVFDAEIKAGASGNVGIASWETALQFNTGLEDAKKENFNKVKISMPVWVQVAF